MVCGGERERERGHHLFLFIYTASGVVYSVESLDVKVAVRAPLLSKTRRLPNRNVKVKWKDGKQDILEDKK